MNEEDEITLKSQFLALARAAIAAAATEPRCEHTEYLELLRLGDLPELLTELLPLQQDSSELVRATLVEIVTDLKLNVDDDFYIRFLNDSSSLVRQCAAVAMGESCRQSFRDPILNQLPNEEDPLVRQKMYYALWRLGDHHYSFSFLDGIFSDSYQVRCFTVNLLGDFVASQNKEFFVNLVKLAQMSEETGAAKSSMADFLQAFEDT